MSREVTRGPVDPILMERSVVETALPCHMLWLMSRTVVAAGYELRPDIVHRLNAGAAAPLHTLAGDPAAVSRVAKRVDDLGMRLLNVLSPDDPVHGLYSVAMFVLKLVDELLLDDPDNMGVLVSMLLIDDIKQEGGTEKYVFKELILRSEADKLVMAARKEGVYTMQLAAPTIG